MCESKALERKYMYTHNDTLYIFLLFTRFHLRSEQNKILVWVYVDF